MNKIVKNYIYNFAYQIFVLLVPVVTAPYLSRTLGASNLGIYSYVSSSTSIIQTISLLGIYTYGNRQTAYLRGDKEAINRNFWEIMFIRLLLSGIGTVVYFVYAQLTEYSSFFLLYYPYILANFIDCSWLFVGMEDMKPAVVKNFFAKFAGVICIFLFVHERDDTAIYIFILAISTFVPNILIYKNLKKYIFSPQINITNLSRHLKGSVNLFLPEIASLIYLQMDKIMLEWITGDTAQISYYDQAGKLVTIPLTIITVLSTVLMPRIAAEYKDNERKHINNLINKAGVFSLFLAFPMMFGLASIADKLIPWYLGNEFIPTIYAMIFLSPLVLLNTLTGLSGTQYFTATDQINIIMKAYISAAISNLILNTILIPVYGYIGAAIATVFANLISAIIQYKFFCEQINLKPLIRPSIKYLVISIIMVFVIRIMTRNMAAYPITTILQIIIGIVVYIGANIIIKDPIIRLLKYKFKFMKYK